jgi:hypothetical protein
MVPRHAPKSAGASFLLLMAQSVPSADMIFRKDNHDLLFQRPRSLATPSRDFLNQQVGCVVARAGGIRGQLRAAGRAGPALCPDAASAAGSHTVPDRGLRYCLICGGFRRLRHRPPRVVRDRPDSRRPIRASREFASYRKLVEDWGVWIIIAKSFTPIPFKFIAVAAGVAGMNILAFAVAAIIGRVLHFAIVAVLVVFWGQRFLQLLEKYERWLVGIGILTVIGLGVAWAIR